MRSIHDPVDWRIETKTTIKKGELIRTRVWRNSYGQEVPYVLGKKPPAIPPNGVPLILMDMTSKKEDSQPISFNFDKSLMDQDSEQSREMDEKTVQAVMLIIVVVFFLLITSFFMLGYWSGKSVNKESNKLSPPLRPRATVQ